MGLCSERTGVPSGTAAAVAPIFSSNLALLISPVLVQKSAKQILEHSKTKKNQEHTGHAANDQLAIVDLDVLVDTRDLLGEGTEDDLLGGEGSQDSLLDEGIGELSLEQACNVVEVVGHQGARGNLTI